MKTSVEIERAIDALEKEIEQTGRMAEAEVCALYQVDCRSEIITLITEELAVLEEEYERALEREESGNDAIRRIVRLSGLQIMPSERLMMEMGF